MKQPLLILGLIGIVNFSGLKGQDTTLVSDKTIIEEGLSPVESQEQKISILESQIEKIGKLKISGYIQAQWQHAEQPGINGFQSGGGFDASDNRFNIRRGRIKFTYTSGIAQMVVQPDFSEKGVSMKDAYLKINSPSQIIGAQMGLFDHPFGYEISYSSSLRESPERSRVYLSLFPGERDLGAMAIVKGGNGAFKDFTLNAGIFTGNGIGVETDSKKDFIGRLAYLNKQNNAQFGMAFSYYNGGVFNNKDTAYTYKKDYGFEVNENMKGTYSKREYFGLAVQYIQQWALGTTNLRAEYLWGSQAGIFQQNNMPRGSSFAISNPKDYLYNRKFNGYYIILVQNLGATKHSIVLKYDGYDPNTQIKGNEIGSLKNTGAADIAYSTLGLGYLYRWNENIRLMAYYDMIDNETSTNLNSTNPLKDFSSKIKQNVLTLRVQIKF